MQQLGVILPQIRVAGTVTRRAVEPTWLTASNPKVHMTISLPLITLLYDSYTGEIL